MCLIHSKLESLSRTLQAPQVGLCDRDRKLLCLQGHGWRESTGWETLETKDSCLASKAEEPDQLAKSLIHKHEVLS